MKQELEWYNNNVKKPVDFIKTTTEKSDFITQKREEFINLFSSSYAEKVLKFFDEQIEFLKPGESWAPLQAFTFPLKKKGEMQRIYFIENDTVELYSAVYEEIKQSLEAYIQKNGLITPIDFDEFFSWYLMKHPETGSTSQILRKDIVDFHDFQLQQLDSPTTPPAEPLKPEPEPETTASKIARILEPLRGAFDNSKHIDTIIEGFVYYLTENKYPTANKAVVRKKLVEFILPFREIQDTTKLKQKEISYLLLLFIEGTMNSPAYAPGYINKLLSTSKPKE